VVWVIPLCPIQLAEAVAVELTVQLEAEPEGAMEVVYLT
jgi:hypothetical protein